MSGTFASGKTLTAVNSQQTITVLELLGSGAQGEVYKVEFGGHHQALKWYHEQTATSDQKNIISSLIESGPPGDNFLWPSELVKAEGHASFGYLMPLREHRFNSFSDVVSGRVDPRFEILLNVCLNLANAFHNLHAAGLCYKDINFGNGFFDPRTGEILICDNDNVSPNLASVNTVLGSPDFMAPEIVLGTALPSRHSDYFSLAVLLFYLLFIQHPLSGRKKLRIRAWDLPAREKLYGSEALFIFDPDDKSNAAIEDLAQDPLGEAGKNAIPYWENIYPETLRRTFLRAFGEGIHSPDKRPQGSAWTKTLTEVINSISLCACGKEVFWESSKPDKECWSCNAHACTPFRFITNRQEVVLYTGKKLLKDHLDDDQISPNAQVIGEVIAHPTKTGVMGLKNQTQESWSAQPADGGPMFEVPPGKSVPLAIGTKVVAGSFSGKIVK